MKIPFKRKEFNMNAIQSEVFSLLAMTTARHRVGSHTMTLRLPTWEAIYVKWHLQVISAADTKSAFDLFRGTTGCQASRVELKEMSPLAASYPIKCISEISNVEFEQGLMRTWQAYGIGRGKQIPNDHEKMYAFLQQNLNINICKLNK